MKRRILVIGISTLTTGASVARADAFDIPFLLHAGRPWTALGLVATILFFMLGNFALNFIFLGFPAAAVGHVPWASVAKGTAGVTILGQAADLLARYAATKVAGVAGGLEGLRTADVLTFFSLNLVLSGVAVGILVWLWARRYWRLRAAGSVALAGVAAILTNPGWATGFWLAAGWADHVA